MPNKNSEKEPRVSGSHAGVSRSGSHAGVLAFLPKGRLIRRLRGLGRPSSSTREESVDSSSGGVLLDGVASPEEKYVNFKNLMATMKLIYYTGV